MARQRANWSGSEPICRPLSYNFSHYKACVLTGRRSPPPKTLVKFYSARASFIGL